MSGSRGSDSKDSAARWLRTRSGYWSELESASRKAERGSAGLDRLRGWIEGYRALAHDAAQAQQLLPETRIAPTLRELQQRLHALIFRPASRWRADLAQLYRSSIPADFRALRGEISIATVVFVLASLAGALLVLNEPDAVNLFLDADAIDDVRAGKLWTDGLFGVVPPSLLATGIMTNNIFVCLTATVLGTAYGIGTLYSMCLNGLMLGSLLAFTHDNGVGAGLLDFIAAHGPVELSVIAICGGLGLHLGSSIAHPGDHSRSHSFRMATLRCARLLALCVPALVVAGLIEGYVSPNPHIPTLFKLMVGVLSWIAFAALISGRTGWHRKTPAIEESTPT